MEATHPPAPRQSRHLRPAVAVIGLGAAAWGAAAAPTLLCLPAAALAAAGALAAGRRPALGFVLLFAAAAAGPLAAGASWIGPGVAATVAGLLALAATANPFAEEIAAERGARGRTTPPS